MQNVLAIILVSALFVINAIILVFVVLNHRRKPLDQDSVRRLMAEQMVGYIQQAGWDVGRLGAQGLCNICTPVSASNAQPGDLVFFVGTYDTPGVSHVGIYVGNNMMIHCGDPISYANLNSNYWQEHFYCYGRLP